MENLAESNEVFLEEYLGGETTDLDDILEKGKQEIKAGTLYCSLFGSAKLGIGIDNLLDSISTLISEQKNYHSDEVVDIKPCFLDELKQIEKI